MNSVLRLRHAMLLAILLTSTTIDTQFTISSSNVRRPTPLKQITASNDPREVLTKAWAALETAKSFRSRIECSPSCPDYTVVTEFVSPDRYRTIEKNQELIGIGDDLYKKKGDKPWMKIRNKMDYGDGIPTRVLKAPKRNQDDSMKTAKDVKLVGADTVDGVKSLLYGYNVYDPSGETIFIKMKVWVGVTDGLMRKVEGQYQLKSSVATLVYTYYDYNADIKIEPPAVLPVPETKQGDPILQPKRDDLMPTGRPRGVEGRPSPGPGTGGGMGSGAGTGVGPGRGMGGNASLGSDYNPDGSARSVDSKPILLNQPQPLYTEEARKNKIEGVVRVRVLVGADGRVKRASIVVGLPDGLNGMASQAAHQMQFKPAMKGGQPVAYWLTNVVIEFKLDRK